MERLRDGFVLGAEGYLFELERRGYLKSGPYVLGTWRHAVRCHTGS